MPGPAGPADPATRATVAGLRARKFRQPWSSPVTARKLALVSPGQLPLTVARDSERPTSVDSPRRRPRTCAARSGRSRTRWSRRGPGSSVRPHARPCPRLRRRAQPARSASPSTRPPVTTRGAPFPRTRRPPVIRRKSAARIGDADDGQRGTVVARNGARLSVDGAVRLTALDGSRPQWLRLAR
jgi:hypothetical protein